MKIRSVRAELFHADGRTDRNDGANRRFRNSTKAPKNCHTCRGDSNLFWTNETASIVEKCFSGEKQKVTVLQWTPPSLTKLVRSKMNIYRYAEGG